MPVWLVSALALIPVAQSVAAGLKSISAAWDPNYRLRLWYKFWNTVAAFPGTATVAAVTEIAATATATAPKTP